MNAAPSSDSPDREARIPGPQGNILSDALRYWEWRRIFYNLVLATVVALWLITTWPHFRNAISWQGLLFLVITCTLANLCYCAAYVADIPAQYSGFQSTWRRWRWSLWVAGTLFAVLIANYWIADEVYPYVR